ncbi:MAG TPA: hypothetical protein VFF37_06360 [Streptomyces sp.]|nr:hypothetical protein [Planctomycetota bacterium]HZX37946.1 hypothetical protein [Streptomyces sp.]
MKHSTPVLAAAGTGCAIAHASRAPVWAVVAAGLVTALGVWALVWAADHHRH